MLIKVIQKSFFLFIFLRIQLTRMLLEHTLQWAAWASLWSLNWLLVCSISTLKWWFVVCIYWETGFFWSFIVIISFVSFHQLALSDSLYVFVLSHYYNFIIHKQKQILIQFKRTFYPRKDLFEWMHKIDEPVIFSFKHVDKFCDGTEDVWANCTNMGVLK